MNFKSAVPANPLKRLKRIVIAVTGGTVLALGVALIVLPGPAFIVIPTGLAILAVEFAWAKRLLQRIKKLLPKKKPNGPSSDKKSC